MASGLSTAVAAGLKSKIGVAVLAALLATGGATGAAAAAAHGAFGQQVKQHVESCKDQLQAGTHGIGECVSDFAQQHGQQQRQQHSEGNLSSPPGAHGTSDNAGTSNTHGASGNAGHAGAHGKPSHPGKPATPGNSDGHGKP